MVTNCGARKCFFGQIFAIAELHELLDLQRETTPSRIGNFKDNSWQGKYKI
jgi:hypothetical protein